MRKLLRPILVLLAIVFLIEAWLWDRLEPIVARIVNVIPWGRIKIVVTRWVETLPPTAALLLFGVPAGLTVPLKLVGLWLIGHGDWAEAVATLVAAKFVAVGVTAFIFDVARDKLLQLDWFRLLYGHVMWLRRWAHALVDPIKQRIRMRLRILAPRRASRAFRLLMRFRRRAHVLPRSPTEPLRL